MDLKMNNLNNKMLHLVIHAGYKGWDITQKIHIKLH